MRSNVRAAARRTGVWLLPVVAIWVIYFSPRHVVSAPTVVTGLLAVGVLTLAVRRPDRSLLALIIVLPFQGLILAKLWAWGLPASVVSHMGAWKETLALAVIIAGFRSFLASGRRADALDRTALAFLALVALYGLLQPQILPGAPSSQNIRLLGFRESGGFVLLMLGARHAPLGPRFAERASRVVFLVGFVVAAIGVYEATSSAAWNRFIVHTIKYPAYQSAVLHGHVANPQDIRIYGIIGGTRFVRIGSVLLDELNCAFYLVLPFAVGVERIVRRDAFPFAAFETLVIGAALLLTQTRSGILAALIVVSLALARTAGRPHHWRTQVAIALVGLAIIAVPAAVSTGVVRRFQQVGNNSDQSTAGHTAGFWSGLNTIANHPLGQGLGTAAGIGQRFTVANFTVPENTYLDVGVELGILPMLIFAALTIRLVWQLRAIARSRGEPLLAAACAAGAGLAVAGWFLQVWLDFGVAWTYWGVAGSMLGLSHYPVSGRERLSRSAAEPAPIWTPEPVAGYSAASSASR